jgi:hypothetical protein
VICGDGKTRTEERQKENKRKNKRKVEMRFIRPKMHEVISAGGYDRVSARLLTPQIDSGNI